jgi:hypothetical protein
VADCERHRVPVSPRPHPGAVRRCRHPSMGRFLLHDAGSPDPSPRQHGGQEGQGGQGARDSREERRFRPGDDQSTGVTAGRQAHRTPCVLTGRTDASGGPVLRAPWTSYRRERGHSQVGTARVRRIARSRPVVPCRARAPGTRGVRAAIASAKSAMTGAGRVRPPTASCRRREPTTARDDREGPGRPVDADVMVPLPVLSVRSPLPKRSRDLLARDADASSTAPRSTRIPSPHEIRPRTVRPRPCFERAARCEGARSRNRPDLRTTATRAMPHP